MRQFCGGGILIAEISSTLCCAILVSITSYMLCCTMLLAIFQHDDDDNETLDNSNDKNINESSKNQHYYEMLVKNIINASNGYYHGGIFLENATEDDLGGRYVFGFHCVFSAE